MVGSWCDGRDSFYLVVSRNSNWGYVIWSGDQAKNYSMEDLQTMLMEMAQGFQSPPPSLFCGQSAFEQSGCSKTKRTRLESHSGVDRGSALHVPSLGNGFFSF